MLFQESQELLGEHIYEKELCRTTDWRELINPHE